MNYRRIIIAVQCEDDKEQAQMQEIARELSQTFKLNAKDIIKFYPLLQKNSGVLISAFRAISQNGMRGVMQAVPSLIKNFKR